MSALLDLLKQHRAITIDNFLSPEECQWYLDQYPKLTFTQTWVSDTASDYTGKGTGGHSVTTSDRVTSQSAYGNTYYSEYLEATNKLRQRFADIVELPVNHVEPIQTSRYYPNTGFDYHEDCGLGEGNERRYTALLYLDQPVAGGQTHFKILDKIILPEPGRLLIWDNLTPDGACDHSLLHAGLPVQEGIKSILVTWIRVNPQF